MAGIDTTTLMMVMMMSGRGGSNNMLLPLLLMGGLGGNGGSSSLGTLGTMLTPQNMMLGMMPGIGMAGKALLGGAGAVVAGSLLQRRSNKRRTKVKYVRSRRR